MEFHDLAWWEEQLGLDKAGRAQLEEDLQTAKKKFPKPDELHTEKWTEKEYAEYVELLDAKGKAWERIFDALGVDDSLDGLARMESFIGGVFSSELAPELEGCLYAGGMSVGDRAGLMWQVMGSYEDHGYISSTEAGRLMNNEGFQQSLADRFPSLIRDRLGGDPSETDPGTRKRRSGWSRAGKLFDSDTGVLGRGGKGDVPGLNDWFSERYVSSLRGPDVETFFMGDPVNDKGSVKVSMRTELDALLKNKNVETVNGVRKGLIAVNPCFCRR